MRHSPGEGLIIALTKANPDDEAILLTHSD
jgi:hypothetical protein